MTQQETSLRFPTVGGDSWSTIVSGLAPISKGGHYAGLVAEAVS